MRLVCLLLALFVFEPTRATTPFKVMTFNIRYDGRGKPTNSDETPWNAASGMSRRDMVLQVIAQENPDLLALQEARPNQVDDVQSFLREYGVYSIGRDDGKRAGEHCSIFFRSQRFEQLDAGTFWLCQHPEQPGEKFPGAACPRIASWVRLRDRQQPETQFVMVNTHWDHVSQPAREFSAAAIVDHLAKLSPDHGALVVGDMNATYNTKEIQLLLNSEEVPLFDAYRLVHPEKQAHEATFNGFANRTAGERIDFVMHSKQFTPTSARIVRTTSGGKNVSDHFPVVVELK